MYKKVIYKSKEEAAAALQKMVQRKREWVAQAEKELKEIATERQLAI
jgi:phytoene/squalene synthetase